MLRHGQVNRPANPVSSRIEGRRLELGTSIYLSFDVHIFFEVKPEAPFSSVFDVRALREILRIERHLRDIPEWRAICDRTTPETKPLCQRGLSFTSYAFAEWERPVPGAAPSAVHFGGNGLDALPQELSLGLVRQHGLSGLLLPVNESAVDLGEVRVVRTVFRFRFTCCTTLDPVSYREPVTDQLQEDWLQFYNDVLSPVTAELSENTILHVRFHGSGVPGHGVDSCSTADPLLPDAQVFDAYFESPPFSERVYSDGGFSFDASDSAVPWCEARRRSPALASAGHCSCFRRQRDTCVGNQTDLVTLRLVLPRDFPHGRLSGQNASVLSSRGQGLGLDVSNANWSSSHRTMAMQGEANLMAGLVVQASGQLLRQNESSPCGWTDVCFCGASECQLDGLSNWTHTEPIQLDQLNLNQTAFPEKRRHYVHVVWGLVDGDLEGFNIMNLGQTKTSPDVHRFQDSFFPQLPQTQRDVFGFCQNMPEDLHVREKLCWMEDFRDWLKHREERFPVPLQFFHDKIRSFSQTGTTGASSGRDFLWVADGNVRAFFASFLVDVPPCLTGNDTAVYKSRWDRYLEEWNSAAHESATGAWHTSRLWEQLQYHDDRPDYFSASGGSPSSAEHGRAGAVVALAVLMGMTRLWR